MCDNIVTQVEEQIKRIKDESKIRRDNRGNGICRYGNNTIMALRTKGF